ncbi:hypothetical protein GCM10010495_36270 [Kitasatospora herbaricolor]|uniref:hypothetical protein n=1 Tax=Kitasatospora herbaricolor TaxID=68217 RepID=UPI00174E20C8|nr:hypothetical protein [Kitasatospora herbaricolor]MDQ0310167.1 hypothetical protein [Kitasatospora herbaricolor]GGV18187.1 hypothetical protein GCM10010495_36270 [Kitasatospora herbaricolor]
MTVTHTWSYEETELAWLRAALAPSDDRPGHVVAELVPGGFAAYLRIFHRFETADGSGRTRRWRDLAQESGALFHGELSHHRLLGADGPDGRPLWQPVDGEPDAGSRQALVRALAGTTGGRPVFFGYDLALLVRGADGPAVRSSPPDRPESVRADMTDSHAYLVGPEFWWPQDRSWVVTSDYDLVSGYIGCSAEPAERILAEPGIEALPVTLRTRVDFSSDQLNRPSEM